MIEIGMSTVMKILSVIGMCAASIVITLGILAFVGNIIDNVKDIKEHGKYYMKYTRHEEIFSIMISVCTICILIVFLLIVCGVIVINMNK